MKFQISLLILTVFSVQGQDQKFHTDFFKTYCLNCHDKSVKKGDLDLESLPFDFSSKESRSHWELILEYVEDGSMPTKKAKIKLPEKVREEYVQRLQKDLIEADKYLKPGGSILRRLNRTEYENSIGIIFPIRNLKLLPTFPKEAHGEGFDTDAEHQYMTATLFKEYSSMANEIASRMVLLSSFEAKTWTYLPDKFSGYPIYRKDSEVPFFSGLNNNVQSGALSAGSFYAPYSGKYEVDLMVWAEASKGVDGKALTLEIYAVDKTEVNQHLLNFRKMVKAASLQVSNTKSKTLSTTIDLEQGDLIYIFCKNRYKGDEFKSLNKADRKRKEELRQSPTVALEKISIKGPTGPNERQVSYLGDYRKLNVPLVLKAVSKTAESAYRRPLSREEKEKFEHILKEHIEYKGGLTAAAHYSLRKILCSPHFLFREVNPGRLNAYDLAARLSFFLWSSPPDRQLLERAADKSIFQKAVLENEVERMLNDRQSAALTSNFAGQWLGNRVIENIMVCDVRHTWGEGVRRDYIRCTDKFFEEILKKNLSIKNFIDSEFTYETAASRMALGLEEALEKRIESGNSALKRVSLKPGDKRGGILGLPGVMLAGSDGVKSSPILRGVWVLDNLFGTPPPPPPDNVEVGKVDVSKAKTVKEMLQMHKEEETCSSCHKKIDPLGLALENFDAVGKWRVRYREESQGGLVNGPAVESRAFLPDGTEVAGSGDIKDYLMKNNHLFTRCLTIKLLEYGTGRKMTPGDKAAIQKIVEAEPEKGFDFKDLIKQAVLSEVFLNK